MAPALIVRIAALAVMAAVPLVASGPAGPIAIAQEVTPRAAPKARPKFERTAIGAAETLTGVIALGGGEERVREAGRLARLYPHTRVLVLGVSNEDRARALLGPWIDAERIQIEILSKSTRENAQNGAALAKPAAGERWLLVTSQSHMQRALCALRRVGFTVEPWPTAEGGTPQQHVEVAAREEKALALYHMLGWCSSADDK